VGKEDGPLSFDMLRKLHFSGGSHGLKVWGKIPDSWHNRAVRFHSCVGLEIQTYPMTFIQYVMEVTSNKKYPHPAYIEQVLVNRL
jgi:hypothetical protein